MKVTLNALIALMGDTWEKVQENAEATGLLERANLLLDFQVWA